MVSFKLLEGSQGSQVAEAKIVDSPLGGVGEIGVLGTKRRTRKSKKNVGELGLLGNNSELDIFPPSFLPPWKASYLRPSGTKVRQKRQDDLQ